MNDGPTPDDFRAKVFRDRKHTGDWREPFALERLAA
jgi:hypothetical protein